MSLTLNSDTAAGVLLRRMLGDPGLAGTTHVIVDEVHEHSVDSDMLLLLLRDLVASGRAPHLRVVLMSATADAELFARYFTSAAKPQQVSTFSEIRAQNPGFHYIGIQCCEDCDLQTAEKYL